MNPLILSGIDIIYHNLRRFAGVILIAVVLIGGPYLLYRKGYNKGYQTGYAQAIKERPTYENVGTVINEAPNGYKILGVRVNIWKLRLGLGI